MGKINKLAKIRSDDCALIDKLMTDFSCHEHSQSWEAPVDPPSPETLETAINSVLDWHEEFKDREVNERESAA